MSASPYLQMQAHLADFKAAARSALRAARDQAVQQVADAKDAELKAAVSKAIAEAKAQVSNADALAEAAREAVARDVAAARAEVAASAAQAQEATDAQMVLAEQLATLQQQASTVRAQRDAATERADKAEAAMQQLRAAGVELKTRLAAAMTQRGMAAEATGDATGHGAGGDDIVTSLQAKHDALLQRIAAVQAVADEAVARRTQAEVAAQDAERQHRERVATLQQQLQVAQQRETEAHASAEKARQEAVAAHDRAVAQLNERQEQLREYCKAFLDKAKAKYVGVLPLALLFALTDAPLTITVLCPGAPRFETAAAKARQRVAQVQAEAKALKQQLAESHDRVSGLAAQMDTQLGSMEQQVAAAESREKDEVAAANRRTAMVRQQLEECRGQLEEAQRERDGAVRCLASSLPWLCMHVQQQLTFVTAGLACEQLSEVVTIQQSLDAANEQKSAAVARANEACEAQLTTLRENHASELHQLELKHHAAITAAVAEARTYQQQAEEAVATARAQAQAAEEATEAMEKLRRRHAHDLSSQRERHQAQLAAAESARGQDADRTTAWVTAKESEFARLRSQLEEARQSAKALSERRDMLQAALDGATQALADAKASHQGAIRKLNTRHAEELRGVREDTEAVLREATRHSNQQIAVRVAVAVADMHARVAVCCCMCASIDVDVEPDIVCVTRLHRASRQSYRKWSPSTATCSAGIRKPTPLRLPPRRTLHIANKPWPAALLSWRHRSPPPRRPPMSSKPLKTRC